MAQTCYYARFWYICCNGVQQIFSLNDLNRLEWLKFSKTKNKKQGCFSYFPDLHPFLLLMSRRANVSDHEHRRQMAGEWPASTSIMRHNHGDQFNPRRRGQYSGQAAHWELWRWLRNCWWTVEVTDETDTLGQAKWNWIPSRLMPPKWCVSLHLCVVLFILSPGLPFIHYGEALTFPRCQGDDRLSFEWNRGFSEQMKAKIEDQLIILKLMLLKKIASFFSSFFAFIMLSLNPELFFFF